MVKKKNLRGKAALKRKEDERNASPRAELPSSGCWCTRTVGRKHPECPRGCLLTSEAHLSNWSGWQASPRRSSGVWRTCASSAAGCWAARRRRGARCSLRPRTPPRRTQGSRSPDAPGRSLACEGQGAEGTLRDSITGELLLRTLPKAFPWLRPPAPRRLWPAGAHHPSSSLHAGKPGRPAAALTHGQSDALCLLEASL